MSVSGGERTVDELLKEALRDKDITYVIKQNDIILLPRENRPAPPPERPPQNAPTE